MSDDLAAENAALREKVAYLQERLQATRETIHRQSKEHDALRQLASSFAINPAIPFGFRAMLRKQLGEPPLMRPPVRRRFRWW